MSEPQTPRKITLGYIVGWAVGVIALIAGIAMVAQGMAGAGIALILAGLVALPVVNDLLASTLKISLSGILRIVIVVALAIVAGVQMPKLRAGESAPATAGTAPAAETGSDQAAATQTTVQAKILLDIDGNGTKTTEKFTTQGDDWDLSYTYDCSKFGYEGNFMVDVKGGDGSPTEMMVNQMGKKAGDTDHYHTGGTFYLEVNSECHWHITVKG